MAGYSERCAIYKCLSEVLQSYSRSMRRLVSILLGISFLSMMLAPAVEAARADSALPLCCRAHGKHHCEGMGEQVSQSSSDPSSDRSLRAVSAKCPMYHFMQGRLLTKFAVPTQSTGLPDAQKYHLPLRQSVIFVATGFSSHTDRGPPSA